MKLKKPNEQVPPAIQEILTLAAESQVHLRMSCHLALKIGLRLLHLHKTIGDNESPGGFRAAVDALYGQQIPRSTAYRWLNGAAAVLARHQGIEEGEAPALPTDPGTAEWAETEAILEAAAAGMSIRRLTIGAPAAGDEARLDALIQRTEAGDPHAEEMLDKVAKGELTLVQAIRAQAGATATKEKARKDPVYLDLSGTTGEPIGLFPKCLITLANTFDRWDRLDEDARRAAKSAWKATIAKLPKELR
jgi:hypothetical protein